MGKGIFCAGIAVADVVVRPVSALPEEGRLSLVDAIELHAGGCAVNTGIGLARLGFPVAVSARVGRDGFGDFLRRRLSGEKVCVDGLVTADADRTSATAVMVSAAGERTFIHCLGANRHYGPADVDWSLAAGYRIFHLAGALLMPALDGPPAAGLLAAARERGLVTSLDTAWDSTGRWLELIAPLLPRTDYFLPSIEEARMLSGLTAPEPVADFFLARGVGTVALKMGAAGSFYKSRDGEKGTAPICPVERVVDATGAGDAFAAGFLAGLHLGWPLARTARLANACGALAVSRMGASDGLRSLADTMRFAGLEA